MREGSEEIIRKLKKSGITSCNMITGDDEGAAHTIAKQAGIDFYISRALPNDKVDFIKRKQAEGHKVIMIGDGINDAPAISIADTGIAMGNSASITGDTADVVLNSDEGLEGLLKTRILGQRLMERIDSENRAIVVFNSTLIALGLMGVLVPSTSALLHNLSTIVFALQASKPLLGEDKK